MDDRTQRLLTFLQDPASYPHRPEKVALVQTHASWVALASPFVFKVKKPVDFGFLDFSTLELRKADCEREVVLNRRLAPDIYLGVKPIRDSGGGLSFGGDGTVVEWVVKMREMDQRFFLNRLVAKRSVRPDDMERLVQVLLRFYAGQPPVPAADLVAFNDRMRCSMEDNFTAAKPFAGRALSHAALGCLSHFTAEFRRHHEPLLERRVNEGWIRDCHGDLHLEHIQITADAVRIYDCVEFNDAFRFIDVACDLAFLAMDLDFNGRPDLARWLVERFAILFDDQDLPRLIDFYKCYRACVRGKVESLHSVAETAPAAEQAASLDLARRYHRLALCYALAGSAPRAFVFMGGAASGKSSLAQALARETGWRVVSSDELRKTLAGVPLHHRGTRQERDALYSSEMTQKTYARLRDEVISALRRGEPVIADATFSRRENRGILNEWAAREQLEVVWIEARADDAVIAQRLEQRSALPPGAVVSDARLEDQETLARRYEPPDELSASSLVKIGAMGTIDSTLSELLMRLAGRQASRP